MRVKQIKAELDALGVSHRDAVEKSDLVDRLVRARLSPPTNVPPRAAPTASSAVPEVEVVGSSSAPPPFGDIGIGDIPEDVLPDGVTQQDAFEAMSKLMSNPEAAQLMIEMEANPRVMQAAMEMGSGGEAALNKYANDPEVMGYLERLQRLME